MRNQQSQINIPGTGMDRDSHPSRVKENTYTFARNISLEDSSGNGFPLVQNEPSNLLCQNFSTAFEGLGDFRDYNIVGFRFNSSIGRTYFMFANENKNSAFYGTSAIGYINKHVTELNSQDYDETCGCINVSVLDKPLEKQEQTNLCDFKLIVEDSCTRVLSETGEVLQKGCLNFSSDNPIFERNIRFKNEQCGRRMYWTDRSEEPRYIDLDMIENPNWMENIYKYKGVSSCGDFSDVEQTCLDCEKLKMIPDYSIPCLIPTNIELGGQLKLGTYEFLIAYCDEEGNELSNYFSHTNPINLFDYNNVHMNQTELARVTNYAIELTASNLDEDFRFYKVAVIQHTEVNGEETYFEEGIHPITDKTVLYTSDRNKKRITLNRILLRRVKMQSVEHMIDSNGYLFMAGIKNKPVLNLQPIVNLIGPYLKWTSVVGKENFYQNGINASNFRSYMRDENYTFSITYGMKDGTETNEFILINRAPQTFWENGRYVSDLDIVKNYAPTDLNFLSIQAGKNACGANERIYRWQYENTARLKGSSALLPRCTTREEQELYIQGLGSDVFSKKDYKTCSIFDMPDSSGSLLNQFENFPIRIDGDYRSNKLFIDYVIDRIDDYLNPGHQLYSPQLATLFTVNRYSNFDCSTTNSCNCIDEPEPFKEEVELIEFDMDEAITPVNTYLSSIDFQELNYMETQFPLGIREEDYGLTGKFVKPNYGSSIHLRPKRVEGNTCAEAIELNILQDTIIEEQEGMILPVRGTRKPEWKEQLTFNEYTSTPDNPFNYIISYQFDRGDGLERPSGDSERVAREFWKLIRGDIFFTDKVSRSALWVKTQDIKDHPYIQINFSPISILELGVDDSLNLEGMLDKSTDTAYNRANKIRVSIYDACSTDDTIKTPLKVMFLHVSKLINLKTELNLNEGEFLIAIDTPIINLHHIEFSFVRKFEKTAEVMGLDGQEVPPHYRFMQKETHYIPALGYATEFLVAHNVNTQGQPGWTGGSSGGGSGSPTAFKEHHNYMFVPPLTSQRGNYKSVDSKSFITSGTDYSIMVIQRGLEIDYTTYMVDLAKVQKVQTYERECFYEDLDEKICEGKPFEEGMFGYMESEEQYPDNPELFNSFSLGITEEMLDETVAKYEDLGWVDSVYMDSDETVKEIFVNNFGSVTKQGQILEFISEDKSNFACKPIRHFKFPNNNVSPFLYTNENLEFQNTFIFPLGVAIDKDIVNIFLDLAVKTGQITQQQRDSIEYFKLKRGDRTLEKTIIAKGLLTDIIKYREQASNEDRYFPNFPFNSLKKNELLSRDGYNVNHPYSGRYNNKFSFNSPEIEYNTITLPTELSIEGFQYGTSEGQVDQVQGHSKMVLLSPQAIATADSLAKTESTFEVLATVGELGIGAAQALSGGGFFGFSGLAAGAVAAGFVAMVVALRSPMIKDRTAELRNKWIEIFKNRGIGSNFAHYITSVGFYNNYSNKINANSRLRRVVKSVVMGEGNYNINHPVDGGYMKVNNVDREKSLFLYLGPSPVKDGLQYLNDFYNIDTSGREPDISSKREMFNNDIANLYSALKVWKSDQYGQIGNIKWIDITGCNFLSSPGTAHFFGGDTFISKYAYKRKFNYFLVSDLGQADFTPFKYSYYFNVGKPKYFIDYETEHEAYGKSLITTPSSKWNLADEVIRGNYITDGRFYHYQYGIPYFFVESTINCWNRYAGLEPWENFYPNVGDYMGWTQEKTVSIRKPNVFKYNYAYSLSGIPKNNNFLPNNFVSKFYNCTNNSPNGIMYSAPDVSEKQKVDPWLIYKNFDFHNFSTSNGKLIDLVNIESTMILGIFENQNSIFNAIDVLKERVSPETNELGSGGIFAQRPIDSHRTDNGYGGTQHKASVSCEFGHFWVDARRGHVHQKEPGGQGQNEITQGMRNWFQEHLPFKVLKGKIDGLTDLDLDNPFKNIGISMGYDSKFKRIFLTKQDYVVKPEYVGKIEWVPREGFEEADVNLDFLSTNKYLRLKETGEEVNFDNKDIFEPAHFTLAYSPIFKTWIAYYSFTPGFYISYDGYFSTGSNSKKGASIWSHLLTNKSYGVFYGKRYDWAIEIPTKEQYGQKMLNNVEYWIDSLRYHNSYDYALNTSLGFDRALIYNHSNTSGYLNLVTREPNNRFQMTQYPKMTTAGTDILVTYDEGKWSFNDFYNRAQTINNNIPLWKYDVNAIEKTPNPKAMNYHNRWQDRLRGDWFLIRLEGGRDSRFKQMFKWVDPKDSIVL